jgi:excisionase family DNA binding protein
VKPLLNAKAVCALLGVSAATLSRMIHAKKIPYVLLGNGQKKLIVRFKEDELEAWIARRSRGVGGLPNAVRKLATNYNEVATENKERGQVAEITNGTPVR